MRTEDWREIAEIRGSYAGFQRHGVCAGWQFFGAVSLDNAVRIWELAKLVGNK